MNQFSDGTVRWAIYGVLGVFLLIGLFLLALTVQAWQADNIEAIANARISQRSTRTTDDGERIYNVEYTYVVNGQSYTVTETISSGAYAALAGREMIGITYLPDAPQQASIADDLGEGPDVVALTIITTTWLVGVPLVFGSLLFVLQRRRRSIG